MGGVFLGAVVEQEAWDAKGQTRNVGSGTCSTSIAPTARSESTLSLAAVDRMASIDEIHDDLMKHFDTALKELNSLKSSVQTAYKGERLDLTVDSGAAVCALPPDRATKVALRPVAKPREFVAANKGCMKEYGQRTPNLEFNNGDVGQIAFSVMDVHKPLLGVSATVKAKHRVVFQPEEYGGCYIEQLDKSTPPLKPKGRAKKVYERNGGYVLPAWVTDKQPKRQMATVSKCGGHSCPNNGQGGHP